MPNAKKLIVVIPNLPPIVCGIGNYAIKLSRQLLKMRIYDEIVVGGNQAPTANPLKLANIELRQWSEVLKNERDNADVFLNFAPTAYSKFGLPLQLLNNLNTYKKHNPNAQISTIFHETWMDNQGLKIHHKLKNFFTKYTATKCVNLSNNVSVITDEQYGRIKNIANNKNITLQKIAPNIEPSQNIDVLNIVRETGLFINFGLAHTRLWTLEKNKDLIRKMVDAGLVSKIIGIGPVGNNYAVEEINLAKEISSKLEYIQKGALEASEVSALMLKAEGGFIGQSVDSLSKSSSFWAFAAHAIPVICPAEVDDRENLKQQLFFKNELLADISLFEISKKERAENLYKMYKSTHSWEIIAADFKKWVN